MNNIAENVFQAVDIIVNKKLEGLQFNRTEQATIIDDSNAEKGQYTVKTETVQYDAFSENTQYRNKQEVLVNIPNNNYNSKKIIVGLANEETGINDSEFIDPIKNMLDITGSLVDLSGTAELVANDMSVTSVLLGSWASEKGQELKGYTRVGVSAEFQTLLGDYNTIKGRYGLKLIIYSTSSKLQEFKTELDFNNKNFYGNSFNIPGYQKQSIVADISTLKDIYKIELYFYQHRTVNGGSFYDVQGEQIPYIDDKDRTFSPNLKVRSPQVIFGYAVEDYNEDQVLIYTENSLAYDIKDTGKTDGKSLKRTLELRWISLDNNGRAFIYNQVPENTIIRWYRKRTNANAPDNYVGAGWEVLPNDSDPNIYIPFSINWDNDNQAFYSDYDEKQEEALNQSSSFLSIINDSIYYNQNYCESFNEMEKKIELRYSVAEEIYKVVILTPEHIIQSKTITFTNQGDVIDKTSVKYSKGLGYRFSDGSDGRYSFYGPDGQILNNILLKEERKIILTFNGADLKEAQMIHWDIDYLNLKSHMLNIPDEDIDNYNFHDQSEEDIPKYNEALEEPHGTLVYTLRSTLNMAQAAQTYIKCDVIYNDIEYNIVIPLSFGRDSSLEYEFNADLYRKTGDNYIPVPAVIYNNDTAIGEYYIKPVIYNRNGKEVTGIGDLKDKMTLKIPDNNGNEFNNVLFTLGNNNDGYYKLKPKKLSTEKYFNTSYVSIFYSDYEVKRVPIPISSNEDYMLYGLSEILYNSAGYPPESRVGYKILSKKTGAIISDTLDIKIANRDKNPEERFMPQISSYGNTDNSERYLMLAVLYISNLETLPSLTFVTQNGSMVWSQPILLTIENHSHNLINNWSGGLSISKEGGGSVMSKALGAGKLENAKNGSKVFSGVMLGDLSDKGDPSYKGTTGLYGYHQGVQAFAFKDDGTAFIGEEGSGRISFDGNGAIIQSGNYKEEHGIPIIGTQIDLDDGSIKSANLNLQNKLYITPDGRLYIDPTAILSSLTKTPAGTVTEIKYTLAANLADAKGKTENKWTSIPPIIPSDNTDVMFQRTRYLTYDGEGAWIDSQEPSYVNLGNADASANIQKYISVKEDGLHISGYGIGHNDSNSYVARHSYGEAVYTSDGITFYGKSGYDSDNNRKELSKWSQDEMSLKFLNKFSLGNLLIQKDGENSFSILKKE